MFGQKINGKRAQKLLENGAKLYDVRDAVAFRDGTLPGAVNLPLRQVSTLMKLPKDTKLILFGASNDDENLKHILNYISQFGFTEVYSLGAKENWDK